VESPDQFPIENGFRMRGARISRIDVFSDVALGFALVLQAVSLAIPKSFTDLRDPDPSLITSVICFLMLVGAWYSQYVFFRRYGLHDRLTVILNAALIFLILFCAYPLKFLYTSIFRYLVRNDFSPRFAAAVQINGMLVLYALGFTTVFMLIAGLYWNGWRHREWLLLNGVERLLTVFFHRGRTGGFRHRPDRLPRGVGACSEMGPVFRRSVYPGHTLENPEHSLLRPQSPHPAQTGRRPHTLAPTFALFVFNFPFFIFEFYTSSSVILVTS